MSIAGRIRSTFVAHCVECGQTVRRSEALVLDGRTFCSVLHEVEFAGRSVG